MNDHMWEHAATQANVATLRARGVTVLEPGAGALGLARRVGAGPPARAGRPARRGRGARAGRRLAGEPAPLAGLRVLVTAGGTREPIDAVRFVGNRSSGRMGFALAEEAAALGADVTVVAANVALPRDPRVRYVDVETAAELQAACAAEFQRSDVLLMAAAVADFRPGAQLAGKLKKTRATSACASSSSARRTSSPGSPRRAAPTRRSSASPPSTATGALDYGRDKLARKGLDAVVVNDVARADIGFDAADNEVTIVTAAGERHVARATKAEVARAVLDAVIVLRMLVEPETTGPAA